MLYFLQINNMKGIQLLLLQKTTKPETTKLGINENSHCKMMHIVDQIIDHDRIQNGHNCKFHPGSGIFE